MKQYPGPPEIHWLEIANPFFVFEYYFFINVPEDFVHETQIEQFAAGSFTHKTFLSRDVTDEHFVKVTDKFIPGQRYAVKIFMLRKGMTPEQCLHFLKGQRDTRLVGAQGLAFVLKHYRHLFPLGLTLLSLDEREHLFEDCERDRMIPGAMRARNGEVDFGLCKFDTRLNSEYGLICFCGPMPYL